ncbi:hypothetical protein OCS_00039 [Ophiocordyceps sinensis CO18]|uniref:Uncharacterized protein n=1 Tax=Ophiocordyceps sinensis (strain Co18 / CGMCC 3.14243) TaxID=911162 RepID=T5AR87_OPHSC|nr:hypothetical protein OCS_00039 [Ophiocordyceps sinensis CO18]
MFERNAKTADIWKYVNSEAGNEALKLVAPVKVSYEQEIARLNSLTAARHVEAVISVQGTRSTTTTPIAATPPAPIEDLDDGQLKRF